MSSVANRPLSPQECGADGCEDRSTTRQRAAPIDASFSAQAPWDERAVIGVAREYALEQLERHGPVAAWVVDDTALPKKGDHSVGVARQAFLTRSGLKKNGNWHWLRSIGCWPTICRGRRWWRTPATVRRASFAKASARAACRTLWGLCTRPRFGAGGPDPCCRHVAVVAVGQPRACGAILTIGQFRCGRWPGAWTPAVGNPCAGAKAPRGQCSPVSRCSRSAWPSATIGEWNHEYRNCC